MDNDGDLDCIVTNDGGQTARSYYYANNGNGTFSGTTLTSRGTRIGCSLADCNGDGALDALMVGYIHTNKILYQNANTNGNAWITIAGVAIGCTTIACICFPMDTYSSHGQKITDPMPRRGVQKSASVWLRHFITIFNLEHTNSSIITKHHVH
ncbi:MAG: FG-GAP-like repeat-containing protein [Candidatus Kapaibacteriota bacterium]